MTDADDRKSRLVGNLSLIHGNGHVYTGKSGSVYSIACPTCLEIYGRRELNSRHLSVLLDKCLESTRATSAYCMKHKAHTFSLDDLLNFPPLSARIPGAPQASSFQVLHPVSPKKPMLLHETGVEVPFPPGKCIPVDKLPEDHVARVYLRNRGYNLRYLVRQFGVSYCTEELKPTPANGIFYRKWECGFKDTPQGRIVFHTSINGAPVGWQARLLDHREGDAYYIWHPYSETWDHVGNYVEGAIAYLPDYNTPRRKLSKYRNAIGMESGDILFGYDAFLKSNVGIPHSKRILVLTEGPLDAARFPRNGAAYTRAHVSAAQARLAASMAHTVVLAADNDVVADQTLAGNLETLRNYCAEVYSISPAPYKDFGEGGYTFAASSLTELLKKQHE